MSRLAAIIPVGTFEGAKSRLGGSLDAEERHDLVDGLLVRTVEAALAVERLDDVLVISPDRAVLARAADLGARTLRQRSTGLRAGLAEARDDVVAGGADALLVLPIDLPFVSVEAIDGVLDAVLDGVLDAVPEAASGTVSGSAPGMVPGSAPTVVLVTDRHGTGTNALVLRPPDAIDFAFGPGSRAAHRALAEMAGASYLEVDSPLSFDIDTPDDLVQAERADAERADPELADAEGADPERIGV